MRDKLVFIWRKITKIKVLHPLIVFIRYFAATNFFNTILDFLEVSVFHTSYADTEKFMLQNKKEIEKIIHKLADEKSRSVYQNIWKYRATHNRKFLKGIVDKDQYFDSGLIKLTKKEGFVDCGAYRGDTVQAFCNHLKGNGSYDFILAFEPDQYNFKILTNYIKKRNLKNIVSYPLGTWNEQTTLRFRGDTEEGCMVAEDGNTTIHTNTIDAVAGDRKVTYIKMDVEGAELKSLIGARKVIEQNHPRLAVSIYHSNEDMINIIAYISENFPFYQLYVRHYTYFFADTVLYAIDWERQQCKGNSRKQIKESGEKE